MECKVFRFPVNAAVVQVLIETLWNVKMNLQKFAEGGSGINRNIVECKDGLGIAQNARTQVLIETLWNVK